MSLLPALFRQPDMPMALGRKIETPVPKKPDPITAFEIGDHRPAGMAPAHAHEYPAFWGRSIPDMAAVCKANPGREAMFADLARTGPGFVGTQEYRQAVLDEIHAANLEVAKLSPVPSLTISREQAEKLGLVPFTTSREQAEKLGLVPFTTSREQAEARPDLHRQADLVARNRKLLTDELVAQRKATERVCGPISSFDIAEATGARVGKFSEEQLRLAITYLQDRADRARQLGYGAAKAFA